MQDPRSVYDAVKYLEVFVSAITLAFSVYFTYKIWRVATISKNLRVIIMVHTVFCLFVSVVHPLFNFIPPDYYSLEDGNYNLAIFLYGLMLTAHILMIMLEFKYLMIAIERVYAYKQRETYDEQNKAILWKLFFICFIGSIVIFSLRVLVTNKAQRDLPLYQVFLRVIHIDYCVWGILFLFMTSSTLMTVSIMLFYYLHRAVKRDEHKSYYLSIRYEIRQTKYVLRYIISLVSLAMGLLLSCFLCYIGMFYYIFYKKLDEEEYQVKSFKSLMMTSVCVYNFACMTFMIREFPQLQQSIFRDLPFLERSAARSAQITPAGETDIYFKYLRGTWN